MRTIDWPWSKTLIVLEYYRFTGDILALRNVNLQKPPKNLQNVALRNCNEKSLKFKDLTPFL